MSRSFYTALVADALFPLQERLKGHDTVRVRRDMERSQWWDPERLGALQAARLRALLQHAQSHVPYYRRVFREAGFDAAQTRGTADLARLPFLTKAVMRAHGEALRSERAGDLARFNTGGSTGEPLIFYLGKERVTHDVAAKWRATRWWGVDIGDPEIVVWGSPIEVGAQDRLRAVRDLLMRTRLLPAFEMSEARLDDYVAQIRAMRPRMLFGYPSALAHVAQHARRRGQRMDDLGVKVAFVTAERLYDNQRELIAGVFGCRVANGYGGRDAGFIAHQCPEGRMHITAEDIVVEIVDGEGKSLAPGQAGEIVVTHLATGDYPFVRYRTGDVGVLDAAACPCGRGLPVLREVQGRSTDFLVAQDGTVMHGLALIYVLRDLPGIEAFKIIQETPSLVRVLIVPGDGFGAAQEQAIESGVRARIGATTRVAIERVPAIQPERSGKYRYVVSHVQPGAASGAAAGAHV